MIRKGSNEGLKEEITRPERHPDLGEPKLHPHGGPLPSSEPGNSSWPSTSTSTHTNVEIAQSHRQARPRLRRRFHAGEKESVSLWRKRGWSR